MRLVEEGQASRAHAALRQLLDQFAAEQPHLGPRKIRCGALIGHCLRAAHQAGAPSEPILKQFMATLDAMAAARTWVGVCQIIHAYLDSLLEQLRPETIGDVERVVRIVQRDLSQNVSRPRSLASYADEAGVSLSHLSRRFTDLVGQTFSEERRLARVRAAVRLLAQTSLKVAAVARRVGLRDPSQFIAEFKSETGMTPARYRRASRSKSFKPDALVL